MTNRSLILRVFLTGVFGAGIVGGRLATGQPIALEELEEAAIQRAVQRVGPAVVRIDLIGGGTSSGELVAAGPTSGVVIAANGDVLSSSFAFTPPPASILITTQDGQQHPATLVAIDHSRQLVLLRIEGVSGLAPPDPAPRETLAVGQWAIAIGRGSMAEQPSVSVGIVSALHRIQGRAVQTDASISPMNYGGPLIDIAGRVIGILTPLSPDSSVGASGTDWYDSGIGFAVPLAEYGTSLVRLQSGENLYRGLAGIAFAGDSELTAPPIVANVRPRGPAAQAGLRAGDRIVALDRVHTETHLDFRRQLGRLYAGEDVTITFQRDQSTLDARVTLARELEPFRHASLGIRPRVSNDKSLRGVEVAELLPDGPASAAGILPGDLILRIGEQGVESAEQLMEAIQSRAPGEEIVLQIRRDDALKSVSITLQVRSAMLLPRQIGADKNGDPTGSQQAFKLPEFSTSCPLYLPSNLTGQEACGLLIVLQSDKNAVEPETLREWQKSADENRMILVLPGPQEERGWSQRDIQYLRQLVRTLVERHGIDRRRVALVGAEVPNNVSVSLWLANREFIRGVWLKSVDLPGQLQLPENEPNLPCLIVATAEAPDRRTAQFLRRIGDKGFSAAISPDSSPGLIAAWADSLDRL